jgi:hypothetical protein
MRARSNRSAQVRNRSARFVLAAERVLAQEPAALTRAQFGRRGLIGRIEFTHAGRNARQRGNVVDVRGLVLAVRQLKRLNVGGAVAQFAFKFRHWLVLRGLHGDHYAQVDAQRRPTDRRGWPTFFVGWYRYDLSGVRPSPGLR